MFAYHKNVRWYNLPIVYNEGLQNVGILCFILPLIGCTADKQTTTHRYTLHVMLFHRVYLHTVLVSFQIRRKKISPDM